MTWRPPQPGHRKESLSAAVFQREGFLVRTSVPLRIASAGIDVTDVDVFGVKYSGLFQPMRVLVDCRDRIRSRPYERILWARGLGEFLGVSDIYVALPKARREVFQFARAGGIRVITDEMLQRAFDESYAGGGEAFGLAKRSFYDEFYKNHLLTWKKEPRASALLELARSLLLGTDSFVSMNIVMNGLTACAQGLKGAVDDPSRNVWKYVGGELIVSTSLLILGIAGATWGLPAKERSQYIIRRLTFGDVSPSKAQELVNLATELATLAAAQKGEPSRPFDLGEVEPPGYAPDLAGLVARAIEAPEWYRDLPRSLDYLIFEQAMQDVPFTQTAFEATFPGPGPKERLKVARNILSLVRDTTGLPLDSYWPAEVGNMPRWEDVESETD